MQPTVNAEAISAQIKAQIIDVPDFPKPGIVFKDITPIFSHGPTLKELTDFFAERYRDQDIDAFIGIESRGFLVGTPVAYALEKGLVLIRKKGKLPRETLSTTYDLEYGQDRMEMHKTDLKPGMKVVVMDDLLATGGTMEAALRLIKEAGAEVVEAAFIVELSFLKAREQKLADVPCFSVVQY